MSEEKTTPEEQKAPSITVPQAEWEKVLEEIQSLRQTVGGRGVKRTKKINERIARVRVVDGQIVTRVGNIRQIKNANGDRVLTSELTTLDPKTGKYSKKKIDNHIEFLNDVNSFEAKIVKSEAEELEIVRETMTIENPDPRNNKNFQPVEMDLTETRVEYKYTIEILGGELQGTTIEVGEEALNI